MRKLENALTWFEIPVNDMARAKGFYEQILDIIMEEITVGNGLKMALFPVSGGKVGGALCEHKGFYKPSHDGALIYLNADPDLQIVLDRVEDSGGRSIIAKTQISPEYGYMAVFEDTEGNRVALRSRG